MGPRRHDVVWTEGARRELDAAIHKIIHRDIKPANILIHEGRPLIADFGIALAVGVAGGGRLTETGLSVGTPHYMSPEQATGDQAVGVATDIYALGAVLFEMLIGDPLYTGSTAQAILGKIIQGKLASATEERASVPPNVDAAIHKALEKLPADRFATAAAFAEALANPGFVLPRTAEATVETESPARTGRPLAVAVAGAAAIALLSFFAGRATTPEPTGALARFTVPAAESLSAASACCGPAQTLSPDGEWFVYVGVSGVGGATMLYRRRLGQLEAEGIPGTEGASSPFFSPDGLSVGFHSDGRIRRVSISGGSPVTVTEISRIDGGSWGDNGLIVFTTFGEEGANLYTVPAAGGEPTPVPSDAAERRMYSWMLPGGDAALVRAGTSRESRIIAVDLMTGREDTLGFGTLAAYASGYLVTTSPDGTLLAQPFDPRRRRTTGPAVALLDGVSLAGPEVGEFTLSVNGTLAYVRGGGAGGSTNTLAVHGPGGPEAVPLTTTGTGGCALVRRNGACNRSHRAGHEHRSFWEPGLHVVGRQSGRRGARLHRLGWWSRWRSAGGAYFRLDPQLAGDRERFVGGGALRGARLRFRRRAAEATLRQFDLEGDPVYTWYTSGQDSPNWLRELHCPGVDPGGNFYAANNQNGRIGSP